MDLSHQVAKKGLLFSSYTHLLVLVLLWLSTQFVPT